MLGWLELHLDDADVLIIAGLHEGAVSASIGADVLLPGGLRAALGLAGDRERVARDAYLLAAASRGRRVVRAVVARRSAAGDPFIPSRLLLRVSATDLPGRLRRLTGGAGARRRARPRGLTPPGRGISGLPPASPWHPSSLAVTDFAAYLRCPYVFWLKRVMRLRPVELPGHGLAPIEFGSLAHEVLDRFAGCPDIAASDRVHDIVAFLDEALDDAAPDTASAAPTAVWRVQVERLRARLHRFAHWHAAQVIEGWRIVAHETLLPEDAAIDVDGEAVRITGRVDRIDRHERSGAWRILDYKTGDAGHTPFDVHHGRKTACDTWLSLQLPLYARLVRPPAGARGMPAVGFVLLPKVPLTDPLAIGEWDGDHLASAWAMAQEIVRSMRRGAFPLIADKVTGDVFSAICQVHALGAEAESNGLDAAGGEA